MTPQHRDHTGAAHPWTTIARVGVGAGLAARGSVVLSRGGPADGLAALLGWDSVAVHGPDEVLGAAALQALAEYDVVILRTESVLEAGITGGASARAAALSAVDARLAAPLLGALEERGAFVFAVACDGVFDSERRTYSSEPVPIGVLRAGQAGHATNSFTESACDASGHRLESAAAFAELLANHSAAVRSG